MAKEILWQSLDNAAAAVLNGNIETPQAAIHADKYNGSLIRTALCSNLNKAAV